MLFCFGAELVVGLVEESPLHENGVEGLSLEAAGGGRLLQFELCCGLVVYLDLDLIPPRLHYFWTYKLYRLHLSLFSCFPQPKQLEEMQNKSLHPKLRVSRSRIDGQQLKPPRSVSETRCGSY